MAEEDPHSELSDDELADQAEFHSAVSHLGEGADHGSQRCSPVLSEISISSDKSLDRDISFTEERIQITSEPIAESGGILCAVCPTRAAKSCLTCVASFCEPHVRQHYTVPALRSHRLVEATEDLEQRLCPRHNRELELYCRTDQTAICGLCAAKEHNGHDITELGEQQSLQMTKSVMENESGTFAPKRLTVDALDLESEDRWKADLSWSLHQEMEQIPHSFLISYHSEGSESQTISTKSCNTTLTGLQPDTQHTVSVRTVLQGGELVETKESESVSTTFHTSERRIVLLGKSGDGKSSSGNTILGEKLFTVIASQDSVTSQCEAQSKIINGRKYTVVDTPGFFDTHTGEEMLKSEIAKCLTYCASGPHAFIIVMKVGRHTELEGQLLDKIQELFTPDVFQHTVILFSHGVDLDGQTIEQFVEGTRRTASLKDLVEKCNGRCHVIDNKLWDQEEGESSNRTQLAKLFNTIEEMVQKKRDTCVTNGNTTEEMVQGSRGGFYTNTLLMSVEEVIQKEMRSLMDRALEYKLSYAAIREKAKNLVSKNLPSLLAIGLIILSLFFGVQRKDVLRKIQRFLLRR